MNSLASVISHTYFTPAVEYRIIQPWLFLYMLLVIPVKKLYLAS